MVLFTISLILINVIICPFSKRLIYAYLNKFTSKNVTANKYPT